MGSAVGYLDNILFDIDVYLTTQAIWHAGLNDKTS